MRDALGDELGLVELPHAMPQSTRLRKPAARQPVRHLLASGTQPGAIGQPVRRLRRRARHDGTARGIHTAGHQHVQIEALAAFWTPAITHTLRHRQRRRTIRTPHDSHATIRRRAQPVDTTEHPVQPIGQLARGWRTHHTRPRPAHRPIRRTPPLDRQHHPLQIHATSQPKHQTGRLLIHPQPMHAHRQADRTSTNTTTALADVRLAFGERAEFGDGFGETGDLSSHVFGAGFAEGGLCWFAALLALTGHGSRFPARMVVGFLGVLPASWRGLSFYSPCWAILLMSMRLMLFSSSRWSA